MLRDLWALIIDVISWALSRHASGCPEKCGEADACEMGHKKTRANALPRTMALTLVGGTRAATEPTVAPPPLSRPLAGGATARSVLASRFRVLPPGGAILLTRVLTGGPTKLLTGGPTKLFTIAPPGGLRRLGALFPPGGVSKLLTVAGTLPAGGVRRLFARLAAPGTIEGTLLPAAKWCSNPVLCM